MASVWGSESAMKAERDFWRKKEVRSSHRLHGNPKTGDIKHNGHKDPIFGFSSYTEQAGMLRADRSYPATRRVLGKGKTDAR